MKNKLVYCLHEWGPLQVVDTCTQFCFAYKLCKRCKAEWTAFKPEPQTAIGEVRN